MASAASPTVMDPAGQSLAQVYAQALLSLADDEDQLDTLQQELDGIVGLLERVEGFEVLLMGVAASGKQRQEMVARIFDGKVSPLMGSFLGVLAGHARIILLGAIAEQLRHLGRKRRGQVEVQVTSAMPLSAEQTQRIVQSLQAALGAQPLVQASVDPSLLGGLVVHVGDRLLDASLAQGLRRLRRKLAQGPGPGAGALRGLQE